MLTTTERDTMNATLADLRDALNADQDACGDLADLPTFGGTEPTDTTGIYSWDETHLLMHDRGMGGWFLAERDED